MVQGGKKNLKLNIVIRDPEKVVFEGEAFALSSVNQLGPFDILPHHINFICMVEKYIKIHITPKSEKNIAIERGVLQIVEDNVKVFLGI